MADSERRAGGRHGAGERDLRLHAGDAVHRELMLALKIAHLRGEVRIEHVAHRRIAGRRPSGVAGSGAASAPDRRACRRRGVSRVSWQVATASRSLPANSATARPGRRCGCHRGPGSPHRRSSRGQHRPGGSRRRFGQQQYRRVVVQTQLPERAPFGDALEALLWAWVQGSTVLAWYLAPHRPKSLPKAPSVSVSAACRAKQLASAAGAAATAAGALCGAAAAGTRRRGHGSDGFPLRPWRATAAAGAWRFQGSKRHSAISPTTRAAAAAPRRAPTAASAV